MNPSEASTIIHNSKKIPMVMKKNIVIKSSNIDIKKKQKEYIMRITHLKR